MYNINNIIIIINYIYIVLTGIHPLPFTYNNECFILNGPCFSSLLRLRQGPWATGLPAVPQPAVLPATGLRLPVPVWLAQNNTTGKLLRGWHQKASPSPIKQSHLLWQSYWVNVCYAMYRYFSQRSHHRTKRDFILFGFYRACASWRHISMTTF